MRTPKKRAAAGITRLRPHRLLLTVLAIVICSRNYVLGLDIKTCTGALGMENGAIPDSSLSGSSAHARNVEPSDARLNSAKSAWCSGYRPGEAITLEYLEVNLNGQHLITGVATQGRWAGGKGQEWNEQYTIEYWRPRTNRWQEYSRFDGRKVFKGNTNTNGIVRYNFTLPFHAYKFRILPHSFHRTICMRFEIYGCPDDTGLISYSAPPATDSEEKGRLRDGKYDGWMVNGVLEGGLGQLSDGEVGGNLYSLDVGFSRGPGWVAWRNDTGEYLEIILEFDQLRNISKIDLFTNNYFSRKVSLFGKAAIYFSIGGKFFNGRPVVMEQAPDMIREAARNITVVAQGGRLARFVKIHLYFATEWIMISEIYCTTEIMYMNLTGETEQIEFSNIFDKIPVEDVPEDGGTPPELLITLLMALIFLLVIVFVCIICANKRHKYSSHSTTSLLRNTFTMRMNAKDTPQESIQVHGANQLSMVALDNEAHPRRGRADVALIPYHRRKPSFVTNLLPDTPNSKTVVTLTPGIVAATYIPSALPNILQNDMILDELSHYEESPQSYDHIYSARPRESPMEKDEATAIVPFQRITSLGASGKRHLDLNETGAIPRPHGAKFRTHGRERSGSDYRRGNQRDREERPFGLADVHAAYKKTYGTNPWARQKEDEPATVVWNIAPSMTMPFVFKPSFEVPSIPISTMIHISNLGECFAGKINMYWIKNANGDANDLTQRVITRSANLTRGETIAEYLKELKFLASLNHDSICEVIGMVTSEMPPLVVIEHSGTEDLCHFLKSVSFATASRTVNEPIKFPVLIFMIIQITCALRYLEDLSVVHRDLAARNCMVYTGNRIKLTDVANGTELYKDDYCLLLGNKPVPLRWLSWESILLDRYTCSGTVWAFGVTVWEILSLCRQIPYPSLTLQDILMMAEQQFYGGEISEKLSKPIHCPDDIYELISTCWFRDDSSRPTFNVIYTFMLDKYKQHLPSDYKY